MKGRPPNGTARRAKKGRSSEESSRDWLRQQKYCPLSVHVGDPGVERIRKYFSLLISDL